MDIVRFALRFPYTFYVLAALILFLGVSSFAVTPTDIFPQINIPVVSVIWQYTGLSTPEMEQRVTIHSQYSMSSSVNGIKNMEAQTLKGISVQNFSRTSTSTWRSPRLSRRRTPSARWERAPSTTSKGDKLRRSKNDRYSIASLAIC